MPFIMRVNLQYCNCVYCICILCPIPKKPWAVGSKSPYSNVQYINNSCLFSLFLSIVFFYTILKILISDTQNAYLIYFIELNPPKLLDPYYFDQFSPKRSSWMCWLMSSVPKYYNQYYKLGFQVLNNIAVSMPREVEIASCSIDFEAAFDSAAFFVVKVS